MIEGNLLRNRHNVPCKILDSKPTRYLSIRKILIIYDIINNRFEQAKLDFFYYELNEPVMFFLSNLLLFDEDNGFHFDGLKKTE